MYAASSALALAVLLLTFETGLCINCYQCVSANSEDCKDSFNKAGKNIASVNCNGQEVSNFYATSISYLGIPAPRTANAGLYCVKMVVETTNGDSFVRTCVEGPRDNMNKTCTEITKGTQIVGQISQAVGIGNVGYNFKYCNVCNSENCNGAAGTAASLTLAAGAAALAYFGYH